MKDILKDRLIKSSVATKDNVDEIIESLCHFDFCIKLSKEQANIYDMEEGYLFPCLRPKEAILPLELPIDSMKLMGVLIEESSGSAAVGQNFFFRLQVASR